MPEISIIVPVYNVEKYLRRCIDSILGQTFKNFECILIDDGSSDNCPKICDEYAAKDLRIQVIHQKNAGVSAARNTGLATARGNWIGFVDSDDWIEPETYETAYNTAKEKNADLVQWNGYTEKNGKRKKWLNPKEGYFSITENATYGSGGSICHKLILKKLICGNNITFPQNIRLGEDRFFAFQCYIASAHCYYLENLFYHYEQRESSAMHNKTRDMILEAANIVMRMQNIAISMKIEKLEAFIFHEKLICKRWAIIDMKNPDFDFCRSLFPEINKPIIGGDIKSSFLFLFIYFHFDFIAAILIKIWKLLREYK